MTFLLPRYRLTSDLEGSKIKCSCVRENFTKKVLRSNKFFNKFVGG